MLHCRLGESIHKVALSYCRNRAPKLFLNEESTRASLLKQHSTHLCKNSPLLLNNRQLPVNSEQEKRLPYYCPTEGGGGPNFSPLFTFPNPEARLGSEIQMLWPQASPCRAVRAVFPGHEITSSGPLSIVGAWPSHAVPLLPPRPGQQVFHQYRYA